MIELKKLIPDFHTHLLFFKLKLTPDTGLKQFQSQGLSPLLLPLHLMVLLELKVKLPLLMPKILKNSLTLKLNLPTQDFHMPQLFSKLMLKKDTGLKQFQSQDLLPLLLPLHLMVLLELKVKKPSLMLKTLSNSSMIELKKPIPDFHTPQLFSKLIPTSHQHTGPKKFQSQDLSPLLLPPLEMLV
jgi:hypothetical protein